MELKSIVYGNADRQQLNLLQTENYLDACFPELTSYAFPPNDSQATVSELNDVAAMTDSLYENEEIQRRFMTYDAYLPKVMVNFLVKRGVKPEEAEPLVSALLRDIDPLITKLKYYFQRPRPYQLSYYLKLRLFPFLSLTSANPSYPSGHAVQAKFFAEIVGNKYPEIYRDVNNFADDICLSRLYMGLHYQSDIDFATVIVSRIMKVQELKLKYQI
jgi:hypothetical protein